MNLLQWKSLIELGLDPDQNTQTDRSGQSSFDQLCEEVSRSARAGDTDALLGALVETAAENRSADVNWWLRFSTLFDDISPVTTADKLSLKDLWNQSAPLDLVAKGYLMRQLAVMGVDLEWDTLVKGELYRDISNEEPLLAGDIMVWAARFSEAGRVTRAALDDGLVSDEDVAVMVERWSSLVSSGDLAHIKFELTRDAESCSEMDGDFDVFLATVKDRPTHYEPYNAYA